MALVGKNLPYRLDGREAQVAAFVGVQRHLSARMLGRTHRNNYREDGQGWGNDIEGAAGEMVYAKATGSHWNVSADGILLPDFPPNVEVRTTASERLLVREDEKADGKIYVLVVGRIPAFEIVGWIEGANTKNPNWREDPTGKNRWAFFVPQAALQAFPVSVPRE